jgi:hypothetical protein
MEISEAKTRRAFLRLAGFLAFVGTGAIARAAKHEREPARAPIDDRALNAFAAEYNGYVARLKQGVVDLKLWERVTRGWRELGQ